MQRSTSCRIDSAQDQLTAYQAWLTIVYLAIKDVLHLFITPRTFFTKRSVVSGRSRGGGGGAGGGGLTLFLGRSGEIFFKRGPPSDFRVWNEWAPTYREVWIRFCVRYNNIGKSEWLEESYHESYNTKLENIRAFLGYSGGTL